MSVVVCQSPSQEESTVELFYRQLQEISELVVLVLTGDFNFLDIIWEYHTAMTCKSGKFLNFVEDNLLSQVFSVRTRKDGLQDLLFVDREGFVEDVVMAALATVNKKWLY